MSDKKVSHEDIKKKSVSRLKRIQGQVKGLEKMIEEDRYCIDILQQVSSVHEALRGFGKSIMRHHMEQCITKAVLSKDKDKEKEIFDEFITVVYKYAK